MVKVALAQIILQIFRSSFSNIILPSFRTHIRLQSHCSETCFKRNTNIMKTSVWRKTVTVPWIWSLEGPHFNDLYGTEPALNGGKNSVPSSSAISWFHCVNEWVKQYAKLCCFRNRVTFHCSGAQCWLDVSLYKEYPVLGVLDKDFPLFSSILC